MDNIINLKDLLNHEILDLYSAESQIIEALPFMIDNTYNMQLKNALNDHLEISRNHRQRLQKIHSTLTENGVDVNAGTGQGFFSRLFGGIREPKCKGIEGLIKEARKLMDENMTPEVRDAAIIGALQKIEHYEIAGYGTALAYARQLNLEFAATLLEETLNEEYEVDDLLTELAIGQLNISAERAVDIAQDRPMVDLQDSERNGNEGRSLFADYAREATLPVKDEDLYTGTAQNSRPDKDTL